MPQSHIFGIFLYTCDRFERFLSETSQIKALPTDAFSRLLTGNATCIFTVEEHIGGPFVEITITVITNFKAMPACGSEDTKCAII